MEVVRKESSRVIFADGGHKLKNATNFGGNLKFDVHEEVFKRWDTLLHRTVGGRVNVLGEKRVEEFGWI